MKASPSARTRAPERTVREKLHAAAAQVFAQKGYAAASVKEIVRKAGVTKPVLYYYFGSKEGIYKAVLEAALRDFEEEVRGVEKLRGGASLRLRRLCGAVFELMHKHIDVVRLMHSICFGPPQGAPFFDFDRVLVRLHEVTRKIIRHGVRAGEFSGEAEAMTLAVLGACNECTDLELVNPRMAVDRKGFEKVLDVVILGMKRKGGR